MKLSGVCILTADAPRLAAFYKTVFQESPCVEGSHYSFSGAQLSVYHPDGAPAPGGQNLSLIYTVPDVMAEYRRLLQAFPQLRVTSPPERRPWGAFSFWFLDPDGNTVSLKEENDSP